MKRPGIGGEGFVLDHYDRSAIERISSQGESDVGVRCDQAVRGIQRQFWKSTTRIGPAIFWSNFKSGVVTI